MKTVLVEEGYPLALRETYFAFIRGSIKSHQYRKLFVLTPSGLHDVIGDGDLACAFYVSSILTLCGLMKGGIHTTVSETVSDLIASGWTQISELQPGAVIVWASKLCSDNLQHKHIGFFLGGTLAVSNSPRERSPVAHHVTYGATDGTPNRPIEMIFTHPRLQVT